MEATGLVTRTRDPANRRVHRVELTEAGVDAFSRLLEAVTTFDRTLRRGLSRAEVDHLDGLLARLRANVG
jgi:MarR family transcriptional regulator for hemolysin